ncbi:hypothetical protein COB64_01860 [Candidatus Wolfebacteria bacterium]|nr:MAG: hypothetical protein COB64_01860 [Candidatus Wolfebacteria bacterium]
MDNIKKIFVADSYNSDDIASFLGGVYGKEVEIEPAPDYFPTGTLNIMINCREKTESRIDVFFLSALLVLEGQINPKVLKHLFGTKDSKIIVISSVENFLARVKEGSYGIDFTHKKDNLTLPSSLIGELPDTERQILLSYLE